MQQRIHRLVALAAAIQVWSALPAGRCDAAASGGVDVMYVYDMTSSPAGADDYDLVAALASMQGIINRDAPILYVNNDGYGRPKYWLDTLSRDGRWLEGIAQRRITDLDAVYRLAAGRLKGEIGRAHV